MTPRQKAPGYIVCAICEEPIGDYRDGWCWTDPAGTTCAAHGDCLRDVGEHELGLTL